jgi:hypothetical protein
LALALDKTKAVEDVDVVKQTEKLSAALSALPAESASALGLDIQRFKAARVRLKDIVATGTAVRIHDAEVSGTLEAEGIRGGVTKN